MSFTGKYLKPGIALYDNQKHNVKLLIHRKRALLSDKVGAGKTLSCLYSFAYLKEHGYVNHLLVMTPLSAYEKEVWKKDVSKFLTIPCISLEDLKDKIEGDYRKLPAFMEKYPIIYCKHTHVKSDLELLEHIATQPRTILCVDEIHVFKNPKCDLTIKARALALKSNAIWGITGTSVSKNLEDLYNIVNFISPWYFGSFKAFRDTYCEIREKTVGRTYQGKLRKITEIVGVKPQMEKVLQDKLEPILITGESFFDLKFHYLDYDLTESEQSLYRKIAKGINLSPESTSEDWLSYVLSHDTTTTEPTIKDVERFSSRFIYLQSAADGVLCPNGTLSSISGTKIDLLLSTLQNITKKGQSCIVYFDFLTPLKAVQQRLESSSAIYADVLLSTGENVLGADDVTEARCKRKPVIILGTRASSESASYYFINNVIFFNIPTVPNTFVQLVGRITRKNSLYPDDLNVYIFRSRNIDLYKLLVVSAKAYQLELVQGKEKCIPDDYKVMMRKAEMRDHMKRTLLWVK